MTPLAITFVHPAILGGLGLASLPIIIHLLNRRRFKMMEWAAMDFLLKAAVRNRRRVRLENLLLLLLRTLLVCLLILAVARPFSSRDEAFAGIFGAEGATERIILLDDSHSMRAGQGNQSAFATAKEILKRLITRMHDEKRNDRVTVILGTAPRQIDDRFARVTVAGAAYERMTREIGELQVADGALDVVTAVQTLMDSVEDRGARVVLHIVSDFRRKDWTDAEGQLHPEILEALAQFAAKGEVRLLDVGSNPAQNVGVVDLVPRDRAVIAGVPATFVARVRNHGPDPVANVQVTFRVGERAQLPIRIEGTLQPGEEAEVTKEFTFRQEGPAVISAEIPSDVVPGDDIRRRVVTVRRNMRFLLVDGEPDAEHYRGETDFLAAALAPPGKVTSGIHVDPISEQSFTGRELDAYDGVFLCNVYRLQEDRLQRLEEYVRAGGGLVFFLGDQVDPQVYNLTLFGRGDEAGKKLLPLSLVEAEGGADTYVNLAAPALDHPLVRFLRGMNEIVFKTASFKRYVRCQALPGTDARVILNYTDEGGSPALAEKTFGEGRVLLFTSAADLEWGDFPHSILYVALLQEAAHYIVKPDPATSTLLVSQPIAFRFDPTRMQRRVSVVPPEDSRGGATELEPDAEDGYFRYDRTGVAGTYFVRYKRPEGEPVEDPYVFNVDPTEGDLRRAELSRIVEAIPGARIERASDEAALATSESDRSEFWRTLVYALIFCAALETLLAWRFGHHGKKQLATEGKQVFVR